MLRWRAICRGNPGRARHCGKRKRAAPDAINSPFSYSRIRFSFLPSSPPTNAHFEMLLLLRWMCPEADMGAGKGRTSSSCTFSDIAPPPEMQPRKEEEEGGGEAPRKQISCFSSSFYPACSLYRNPPPPASFPLLLLLITGKEAGWASSSSSSVFLPPAMMPRQFAGKGEGRRGGRREWSLYPYETRSHLYG